MTYRKFTKSERRILQVLASKPGATSQEVHEAADLHRRAATAAHQMVVMLPGGAAAIDRLAGVGPDGVDHIGRRECLPPPATKQPFPFALAHDGCDVNYATWQQAQAAGLLPPGYVG